MGSLKDAQVLYLAGGQDQLKQLFVANANGTNPFLLSDLRENVVEYALSPDQTKVVYLVQTENLENQGWLVDLKSRTRTGILQCGDALCSRPVWSPDGKRIVYEYTRFAGNNLTGLATLWWMDFDTKQAKPVFQEEQLPGANPRWSPDGKWLSYVTSQDIRLYNLETGEDHVIPSTLAAAADWSPDNHAVLYRDLVIQGSKFVTQLFVYDLSSETITNLTLNENYEIFSPHGPRMAHGSQRVDVTSRCRAATRSG